MKVLSIMGHVISLTHSSFTTNTSSYNIYLYKMSSENWQKWKARLWQQWKISFSSKREIKRASKKNKHWWGLCLGRPGSIYKSLVFLNIPLRSTLYTSELYFFFFLCVNIVVHWIVNLDGIFNLCECIQDETKGEFCDYGELFSCRLGQSGKERKKSYGMKHFSM